MLEHMVLTVQSLRRLLILPRPLKRLGNVGMSLSLHHNLLEMVLVLERLALQL